MGLLKYQLRANKIISRFPLDMIPIKTSDHFRYFIMGSAITTTRRKIKNA